MMKYFILLILLTLTFTKFVQASHPESSPLKPLTKKEIKRQKRIKKFLNSKLGQWLIKRIAKKYQKRKERLERKKMRKQNKGKTWKPKREGIGFGYIIAILFIVLGILGALLLSFILIFGLTSTEALVLTGAFALLFLIHFIIEIAESTAERKEFRSI